uniref:Serine protease snake n=2 Tax=Ceratitis capitata TaxID=7213 RepID=W8B4R8_CERCA
MCYKTIITLLASMVTLSLLVNAQNRLPPIQTYQPQPQQQQQPQRHNDIIDESVTRIENDEFEVDIIVRRKSNSARPSVSFQQTLTTTSNTNRIVNEAKIVFPSNTDQQQSESRRQEYEFNGREREREREREFLPERDNVRRADNQQERRKQVQESERNRVQSFVGESKRNADYFEQELKRRRENELDFERNRPFNGDQARLSDRDRDHERGDSGVREQEVPNRERLQTSENSQNQEITQQRPEGENRRLCEVKYNEYIARIFRNDEETSADANDSEFDGRVLATPGEYPHMTALGFERDDKTYDYKCGGSLISEYFVITAAHCTNITSEVPTIARIGETNLMVNKDNPGPQIFGISSIYTHPRYDGVTYYNDIALLLLNGSVEFTEFVRPIRLWTQSDLPLATAFAMGYGATSFARAPTQRLTDFNLTIVGNDDCNRRLPQLDEVPRGIIESQVCAQDFVMQRDTCQGDSGGPLQYNIRGKRRRKRIHYHLIGITSFGLLCRSQNPGVYTRIYSFLDWIEHTVWGNYGH